MPVEDSGSQAVRHCCVVWHERGSSVDPDLIAALQARRMHVVPCSNAYDALARVCATGHHEKNGPESAATTTTILVLSDPDRLEGVAQVVTLAGRYASRAACWMFDASGSRRLRPVERADLDRWRRREPATVEAGRSAGVQAATAPISGARAVPEPEDQRNGAASIVSDEVSDANERRASDGHESGPTLRLTGEGPIVGSAKGESDFVRHAGKDGGTGHQLSDEELKMLLAIEGKRGQN